MTPFVSILVSAEDHSLDRERFIAACFAQTVAPELFEVVFVDDRDHEEFRQLLARYRSRYPEGPHLHYEILPGIHRARANNRAMQMARGQLLIFLGDDFIAPPTLVASHLALHQREPAKEVVGIGGSLLARREGNRFYRQIEESGALFGTAFSTTMHSVPTGFFYAGNTSVKRSFIEACGAFNENFPFDCWDDYEMGLRLVQQGMLSIYVPEATAEHDHALTLAERCRAMRRLGYSAVVHERIFPESPQPWQKRLKRSPLGWKLRAWRYRFQHAVTGKSKDLGRHFNAVFDSHFVRGYRLAQRGATPDCPSFHDF